MRRQGCPWLARNAPAGDLGPRIGLAWSLIFVIAPWFTDIITTLAPLFCVAVSFWLGSQMPLYTRDF